MNISCQPVKEVFSNKQSGFRVLSCVPVGVPPDELVLNRYGNFSLSGSNLTGFVLYEEYNLEIREDKRSKYEGSYIVIGFTGIDIGETITVTPEMEFKLLKGLMSTGQAKNVHEAYPNFIQMILNNQESEINYDKIYGVGPVYLEKYIDKVKGSYKSILFASLCNEWGITGENRVKTIAESFITPDEAKEAFINNPYRILIDIAKYSFATADKKILEKIPELIDSQQRCEYGCYKILREMEDDAGDTRINANILSRFVKELVPEAYHHVVPAVKDNEAIHYDEATKYVSFEGTYQNELTIAQEIVKRLKNPEKFEMNWRDFRNVDGFDCTDEQMKILELACNESIALLSGGAGTGKSASVKALVQMLDKNDKSYILLAPTGVASKRLKNATGRPASTIHMFLARLDESYNYIDYVIIDEISMVGVELFAHLLSVVPKSKIIICGDEDQLTSISCGNVLQDMIDSNLIPTARLTKVFRYGIGGIATVSTNIKNGETYLTSLGDPDFTCEEKDYKFIPVSTDSDEAIFQILDEYEKLQEEKNYDTSDIIVLSPFNKGGLGTVEINKAIQQRFNNRPYTGVSYERNHVSIEFKVGDKVVNTHNNYTMPTIDTNEDGQMVPSPVVIPIMNGDIGYIRHVVDDEILGKYLIIEFDNQLVMFDHNTIPDLMLGYALSIHKIQGAQSKAVIMLTSKEHRNMTTRNLLYVAASRAQEMLIQIGDVQAINSALDIQENKERDTWLKDMLDSQIRSIDK